MTVVGSDRVRRIAAIQTTTSDEWRATVALHGELDVANAHELRFALDGHLRAGRRVLRVDAAGVEFMDSTALGELVTASERCAGQHGSLILTNVPARLQRLLDVAGLAQVLLVDTASGDRKPA